MLHVCRPCWYADMHVWAGISFCSACCGHHDAADLSWLQNAALALQLRPQLHVQRMGRTCPGLQSRALCCAAAALTPESYTLPIAGALRGAGAAQRPSGHPAEGAAAIGWPGGFQGSVSMNFCPHMMPSKQKHGHH
jgi:hypothetical protein